MSDKCIHCGAPLRPGQNYCLACGSVQRTVPLSPPSRRHGPWLIVPLLVLAAVLILSRIGAAPSLLPSPDLPAISSLSYAPPLVDPLCPMGILSPAVIRYSPAPEQDPADTASAPASAQWSPDLFQGVEPSQPSGESPAVPAGETDSPTEPAASPEKEAPIDLLRYLTPGQVYYAIGMDDDHYWIYYMFAPNQTDWPNLIHFGGLSYYTEEQLLDYYHLDTFEGWSPFWDSSYDMVFDGVTYHYNGAAFNDGCFEARWVSPDHISATWLDWYDVVYFDFYLSSGDPDQAVLQSICVSDKIHPFYPSGTTLTPCYDSHILYVLQDQELYPG